MSLHSHRKGIGDSISSSRAFAAMLSFAFRNMLDSVVQTYLAAADPEPASVESFAERATALVRSYKRDVDTNGAVLRDLRRKLAKRGRELTEVRILDIAIWSALARA